MKLFKKPKWLKPELDEPKYYLHLAILLGVVYGLMQLYDPSHLSLWPMLGVFMVFLTIGDGVAHTVLQMD